MNPVVEAALIGVGGSVIVAVASFLTIRAMTLRQLAEAGRARVWDKRAATYADTITAVRWRQTHRQREYLAASYHGRVIPSEESLVDWVELQGRLFAFAAPQVLAALEAASDAGIRVSGYCLELADVIRHAIESRDLMSDPPSEYTPEVDETPRIRQLQDATRQAVQAANDKDDALIDAIRADLHGEAGRAPELLRPRAVQFGGGVMTDQVLSRRGNIRRV